MTAVFADTSHFVAVLSPRDAHHAAATAFTRAFAGRTVTTESVLDEVANFFTKPAVRARFVRLVAELRADPRTTVVPVTTALFDRGVDLFASRPDKEWSLTDCNSFVVMGELDLTNALTADKHFEQAGFVPLLLG